MKIAVAGTGYVGLSMATLLAQHNSVVAVDIVPEKVEMINRRQPPIQDEYIEKYFAEKELDLTATLDAQAAYKDADFVIVAAPTNYDSQKNFFDTSAVEKVIELVQQYNPNAIIVIKSTIPVGYTESVRRKTGSDNILFSPEFLRESKALYDNLYPSRIIVGHPSGDARLAEAAHTFAGLLVQGAIGNANTTEAVKSFPLGEDLGEAPVPYAIYNIGNNSPENLLDFVTILQEELIRAGVLPQDYDFESHKELVPMQPGDVPVTYAETSALEADFGFKPCTSLREGLRKFAEWYKEYYK